MVGCRKQFLGNHKENTTVLEPPPFSFPPPHLCSRQVLPDWHAKSGKEVLRENNCQESHEKQITLAARIRVSLMEDAAQRDKEICKLTEQEVQRDGKERLANLEFLKVLDHALFQATGAGLARFVPKRKLSPLCEGDTRKSVDMQVPGEPAKRRRSVIHTAAGERFYEVGLEMRHGQRVLPTLHMVSDMGPIGLPAQLFMALKLQLRCSLSFDILHRMHNDVLAATTQAGLMVTRLEYHMVARMRKGPFKPGGANFHGLKGAAVEFFRDTKSDGMIFELMYNDILQSRPSWASGGDYGTAADMQRVFLLAREALLRRGEGTDSKLSRWWSFEITGRKAHGNRALDALILLFVGWKRCWWSKAEHCPLLRRSVGAGTADADPDQPFPGEAEVVDVDAAAAAEEPEVVDRVPLAEARKKAKEQR